MCFLLMYLAFKLRVASNVRIKEYIKIYIFSEKLSNNHFIIIKICFVSQNLKTCPLMSLTFDQSIDSSIDLEKDVLL